MTVTKDTIFKSFTYLEEKLDLNVTESISGNMGEDSYIPINYRATIGKEKTKELKRQELEKRKQQLEENKKNTLFGSLFKK